jgi:preprotein translocase SecE subunit
MAGNRQRRGRRSRSNPQGGRDPISEPHRENVPGELDHASGEVEGFEAKLIAGANGAPDTTTSDEELALAAETTLGDLDDDGDVDADDAELARPARASRAVDSRERGPRFYVFLKACWAELQRVQWPDRRQVGQATAVVIGFVIIAGAYLGIADWAARQVVDLIL